MSEHNADASNSKLVSAVFTYGTPRHDPAAPLRPLSSIPLNLTRFNYFYIEVVNPYWPDPQNAGLFEPSSDEADLAAHKWQEQQYQTRFESGKRKALEEYAHVDPDAFESAWFRAEIKRLRLAKKSAELERIFTAYRALQGRRGASKLLRDIERDQRVFRLVTEWPKRYGRDRIDKITRLEIYIDVGTTEGLSADAVEQIAKRYRRYFTHVVPSPFTPEQFFEHLSALLARMKGSVSTKRT